MKRPCKQDNSWRDVVCEKAWWWRKQGKSGIVGKIALAHVQLELERWPCSLQFLQKVNSQGSTDTIKSTRVLKLFFFIVIRKGVKICVK